MRAIAGQNGARLGLLVGIGLVFGGCAGQKVDWLAWLRPAGQKAETEQPSAGPANPASTASLPILPDPAPVPPSPAAGQPVLMQLAFDVLRIDLPRKEAPHSLKIWNHADESLGDPRLTAVLARNGLRLGVADQDSWPALRAIFEANQARTARRQQPVPPGSPLLVNVGQVEEGDLYFVHGRDGALSGGSFPAGTRYVRIDYALTETDPWRVTLRAMLEVRGNDPQSTYVEQGGEIRSVESTPVVSFRDLTASFTLESGQFLVIGTSERIDNGYLLGSRWLTASSDGEPYETVLCITPQPYQLE